MAKEPNEGTNEEDTGELSLPDFDDEFEHLEETEEETIVEEEEEKKPQKGPPPPPKVAEAKAEPAPAAAPVQVAPPPDKVSREELSFPLTIEVGRIQLPLSQLLSLETGNTLEIGLSPEQGVDLVVNGRSIGKGELIRVGGKIGVRILEIV